MTSKIATGGIYITTDHRVKNESVITSWQIKTHLDARKGLVSQQNWASHLLITENVNSPDNSVELQRCTVLQLALTFNDRIHPRR